MSNKASSFHLAWRLPKTARAARLVEVSATLEVVVRPSVPALYFWALQVDFVGARGTLGGGHTGLQWNSRYPGGTAANWGGYASRETGGSVLPGSTSALAGFVDDPNTLAYPWQAGRLYRFRVYRSPEVSGAWRAETTDVGSGEATVIRDLFPGKGREGGLLRRLVFGRQDASVGDEAGTRDEGYLVRPIVWSEVFAECDAPAVAVRWSDLQAVDETGAMIRPEAVLVNYQSIREGGCPNTSVTVDDKGVLQLTNATRVVEQGAILTLQGSGRGRW